MATITEDYVSFETAKLLKEKGFSEKTVPFYQGDGTFCSRIGNVYCPSDWNHDKFVLFSAPTHQMAMKWLREKYNLFIQVTIVPYTTITMEQKYYLFSIHKDRRRLRSDDIPINYYNTYEQAVESAIKYCLENFI